MIKGCFSERGQTCNSVIWLTFFDPLERLLSKKYSYQGNILDTETFQYDNGHLVLEVNKEGHERHFQYDKAGRKVREKFCDKIIDFSYDGLGRLAGITKHNDENTLCIQYKRDLQDRIVEESQFDLSGNLLHNRAWTYNIEGQKISQTRYIDQQECTETFKYDSLNRLVQQYVYIYTPNKQIIDVLKRDFTIESFKAASLEELDYPY
jgi:YD repeat-containing protein